MTPGPDEDATPRAALPGLRRRRLGAGTGVLASALALCALPLPSALAQFAAATPAAPIASDATDVQREAHLARGRFAYKADGKRLTDVLKDFAASQGVPAVVDPKVEGVVSGNFDTTPREFLDAMVRAYSLLWYHDGTALYFYPSGAIQSRIFRLKGYRQQQVTRLLDSLGLSNQRYPNRYDATNSTLLVYGPPRHVELVGLAVESLDVGAIENNRRIVRIFPLRHASAGDRSLGGTNVVGITATLRAVFGGGNKAAPSVAMQVERDANRQMAPLNRAVQGMTGSLESRGKLSADGGGRTGGGLSDDRSGSTPAPRAVRSPLDDDTDEDTPTFETDEGGNAVIVYGKARRMADIATLIRALDVPAVLVELEATIIDVSTEGMSQLGVDWSARRGGSSVSVSPAGSLANGAFTLSTVLSGGGRELLARVNALEGTGRARIVSKPRVLGLANRPAVMVEKRVANVRVSGNLEANLFQIDAGTVLQITPQVTPGTAGEAAQIKLSLFIQDGSFESAEVDRVPVVKRTEIRTEARVLEGESLLIGGISVESDSADQKRIPLLGTLPVIGGAFRQTGRRNQRNERLFLLTPRVIGSSPRADATMANAPPVQAQPLSPNTPPVAAPVRPPAAGAGMRADGAMGPVASDAPAAVDPASPRPSPAGSSLTSEEALLLRRLARGPLALSADEFPVPPPSNKGIRKP